MFCQQLEIYNNNVEEKNIIKQEEILCTNCAIQD